MISGKKFINLFLSSCVFMALLFAVPLHHVQAQETDNSLPLFEDTLNFTPKSTTEAQTANQVENFFSNCVEAPIISVNEETDTAFCACADAHLQKWLYDQKQGQRAEFGDLGVAPAQELTETVYMVDVYGPCLFIPEAELAYYECYNADKTQYFMNNPRVADAMCRCTAEGISNYFENFAKPFLEKEVARGRVIIDPVQQIKRDVNYYDASYNAEQRCFKEWDLKQQKMRQRRR